MSVPTANASPSASPMPVSHNPCDSTSRSTSTREAPRCHSYSDLVGSQLGSIGHDSVDSGYGKNQPDQREHSRQGALDDGESARHLGTLPHRNAHRKPAVVNRFRGWRFRPQAPGRPDFPRSSPARSSRTPAWKKLIYTIGSGDSFTKVWVEFLATPTTVKRLPQILSLFPSGSCPGQ